MVSSTYFVFELTNLVLDIPDQQAVGSEWQTASKSKSKVL